MAIGDRNPNKKAQREKNKRDRVLVQFNTGSRIYKSKKDYSRQRSKKEVRDMTA